MTNSPRFDMPYGPDRRHRLDVFPGGDGQTVIIFWHGGSWQRGDKRHYRFIGRSLAKLGYTTVAPNYRLYPQVRFPAFIEDAAQAVRWVQDNLKPQRVILMGHSAGGLIAADLALDPAYLEKAGVRKELIAGMIGLSGPYDFTPRPSLKPIFADSQRWEPIKLVNSPTIPMLLLQGRIDPTVNYRNAASLAQTVTAAGGQARAVLYPHLEHMLVIVPFLPGFGWIAPIRRQIKDFITQLLD
jgi:acetyl esterase/lipase